ncbi:MAG: CYTH domain-containing protein [Verrucomicrobiae bacterium]|nr:CYTH domain-containing protein [Verrucomicrobiae bacterium]
MGVEIERKFIVVNERWREEATSVQWVAQGYLCLEEHLTVRVRVMARRGWITIKGRPLEGKLSRPEYEYEVPLDEAQELLERLARHGRIEKRRYTVPVQEEVGQVRIWEVDEFEGENRGLVLAEVELREEGERIVLPDWVGQEVTRDRRYANSYLARYPFTRWERVG